ncbi:MAG: peptidoglycan DD-metalloendopeptidase family protein [Candidatus Berkelbacteria bacterium]|nr:peptidoglycan DD-metalloendopeptidase family protein [Candidatus Berkelbacteria bacterium]
MANVKPKSPRQPKAQTRKKRPSQGTQGGGEKEKSLLSKILEGGIFSCALIILVFIGMIVIGILALISVLGTLGFADRPYLSGSVDSPYDCNVTYPSGSNEQAMASYINSIIPSGSPLRGMGDHFVATAKAGNKHPLFIAHFAQKESSWGTTGIATNGSNNPFGRKAAKGDQSVGGFKKFNSWEAAIDDQGPFLKIVYQDLGYHTIDQIINRYCPTDDGCDTQGYIAQVRNFISSNIAEANGAFGADPCVVTGIAAGPGGPGSLVFTWPIPGRHEITSRFGVPRSYGSHEGVDISAEMGDTIVAAADGTVKYIDGGYGIGITIDHNNGLKTIYGHLMENGGRLVSEGQVVKAGQAIGRADSTGNSSGNHLHFTVIVNGQYVDPCGRFISC